MRHCVGVMTYLPVLMTDSDVLYRIVRVVLCWGGANALRGMSRISSHYHIHRIKMHLLIVTVFISFLLQKLSNNNRGFARNYLITYIRTLKIECLKYVLCVHDCLSKQCTKCYFFRLALKLMTQDIF